MKIMVREIMKVLPGKMAEAKEVEKREKAVWNRLKLDIPVRNYFPFACQGDRMHTLVYQTEFDSLATIEALGQEIGADPEMQEVAARWDKILDSRIVEFYTVVD
jgi:hypothetical protein